MTPHPGTLANGFPAQSAGIAAPDGAGPGDPADHRLVSGDAVEFDIRVARLGSRALALLVDILVQALVAVGLLMAMGVFLVIADADDALVGAMVIVIFVLVFVGFPVFCETITSGRTPGKAAMGLRVVRDDGGPIRFRHALTRALVGLAVEWPGAVMPLVTWVASLWTMMVNPHGKRLGDLAAGTIVIHERTPATWGWVPAMPPHLAGWAATLDLTGLDDELALAVRHYLSRNGELREPARSELGYALATEVAAATTPAPPPQTQGWAYLAAVLAERHRRSAERLVRARAATAAIWPELTWELGVYLPPSAAGWAAPDALRPAAPVTQPAPGTQVGLRGPVPPPPGQTSLTGSA